MRAIRWWWSAFGWDCEEGPLGIHPFVGGFLTGLQIVGAVLIIVFLCAA
jgi:hypothetical protein